MHIRPMLIKLVDKNRTCCLAVLLLLTVMPIARAQSPLTLPEAINSALANRKNIQAAKSDLSIRKLQTEALHRKYWPQVNVEYTYLYNPILQTSVIPIGVFNPAYPADATRGIQFGTKWQQTAGLTLNQPLVDLTINRQINEAKLQERIAIAAQAQTEYELVYTVAQVYIDINLQQMRIKTAIADTTRTWASYNLLLDKWTQKRLLKTELNKGKINHNNAVIQYNSAVAQLIEDKVYLLFLIGRNTVEQADLSVDTSFYNEEQRNAKNQQALITEIPEMQQLQLKSELTNIQTKTEKARYLPTLSAKGFLGANQYTNSFDPIAANSWFGSSFIGIGIKYPLLTGEDKQRKVQQLQMQVAQYTQQMEDRAAQYDKDAQIARIKMRQVLSEMEVEKDNITLSIEAVSIFQARVAEGQESPANLNIEEAELQKLTAGHQTKKRQYWMYYLDYLKATGRLDKLWKEEK